MQRAVSRFIHEAETVRVRNGERIVSSSFIALLIALLLWQTKWPALRTGLAILLCVQACLPLAFSLQNSKILRALAEWHSNPPAAPEMFSWFESQKQWTKLLAHFENWGRFAGFAILAYGFWVSTGSFALAVALGLVYPVVIYFGMLRGSQSRALKALDKSREDVRALLDGV